MRAVCVRSMCVRTMYVQLLMLLFVFACVHVCALCYDVVCRIKYPFNSTLTKNSYVTYTATHHPSTLAFDLCVTATCRQSVSDSMGRLRSTSRRDTRDSSATDGTNATSSRVKSADPCVDGHTHHTYTYIHTYVLTLTHTH